MGQAIVKKHQKFKCIDQQQNLKPKAPSTLTINRPKKNIWEHCNRTYYSERKGAANKFKSNYRLNQIQQIKSMVDKEKNKTIYL